jgi:diguanylate cyclase (GGDEF)-like protein/putative nucleotidyltransferase with HDIG domain
MRRLQSIGSELPPRLRWYVLAVIAVGMPVLAVAAATAGREQASGRLVVGIATFLVFTIFAEWRPVPIDPAGKRLVSLAFVFVISSRLIFGWEWSALIGALSIGIAMTAARSAPFKVIFNVATYALAAALSALVLVVDEPLNHFGYASLAFSVVLGGAVFVLANVFMVCLAMSLSGAGPVSPIFRDHLRHSGPIFGIMVFVAAQAVIFWRVSPPLVLLLGAPLFALTLYQRSSVRHRVAEEAASTDVLTGLKNRRAFDEESSQILSACAQGGNPLALCLIDIDRFKQVNDRHGHLAGDEVLEVLARAIDATVPDRGYRLGGDEYALLVEGGAGDAERAVANLRRVFASEQQGLPVTEPVTISAGIALYPVHADDLHALKKRADMALYQSKYNGRDCATVYTERETEPEDQDLLDVRFPMVDIRVVTAQRLAALVDAFADASADAEGLLAPTGYSNVLDRWRNFDGNHSQAVSGLAFELARKLGVEGEELEQVRLAALLHDVGKIAVPEHILSKPGPLTDSEKVVVERHPVIGYELLRDIGLSPVDTYVLHHHERWDGGGYPHGLKGAEIPFGSRLIFVADAFDVLTSKRSYQSGVSVEAAMHELQAESGRQFDPLVVAALHDWLAHDHSAAQPRMVEQEAGWFSLTSRT